MKVYPECIPCFLKQVNSVLDVIEAERDKRLHILKECAGVIYRKLEPEKSPGHNATFIHKRFKELTGIADPYRRLKEKYTSIALYWEKRIEEELFKRTSERLSLAIRLAAVGNVIDFGIPDGFNLEREVNNLLNQPFAYFDIDIFERFLVKNKSVLYIADNAGELVFDKFLLRVLKEHGLKVTLCVRGAPILNDATFEDVIKSGADKLVDEIVTTGGDFIGVDFDFVSSDFKEAWKKAFFVISKGQANIETLDGIYDKDIFFILRAKCAPVAKELGCLKGDFIFAYNKHLLEIKGSAVE